MYISYLKKYKGRVLADKIGHRYRISSEMIIHQSFMLNIIIMGGTQSKSIEVVEISKSKIQSKSPQHSKSPKDSRSPAKANNSAVRKNESDFGTGEPFGEKKSYSTQPQSQKLMQNTNDSRSKKKIKSVKVLPAGLQRHNVPESAYQDLRNSGTYGQELRNSGKYGDSKAKNEKKQLQKLMRIYDLV